MLGRRRTGLPESRLRERRRKRMMVYAGTAVVFLLLLCAGVVFLLRAPFLRISQVAVEGVDTVSTSTIEHFIAQGLAGDYLAVLPKDDIFLYPKGTITKNLAAAYPALQSVKLERRTFTAIAAVVEEREPAALWCGASVSTTSSCLLLDADGLAYAPAPQFSAPPYLPYFGALPGADALPAQFLTPAQFHALQPLAQALAEKAHLDAPASIFVDHAGDVYEAFSSGFELRFALGEDPAKVLQYLSLALTSEPFTSHPLSAFSYLDLRFDGKLYYKLK